MTAVAEGTASAVARTCARRWCAAMRVGPAVEELLAAKLADTAGVFGPRVLSGALVDREGVRAIRAVASSPCIDDEDIRLARRALASIR